MEELANLMAESTAISREEAEALRAIEQAEKDVTRAEDIRTGAIEKLNDAQKELNKLTENSARNILEQAVAQEALTKAFADFGEGTKGYEDAMKKIADITGENLDFIFSKFDTLFEKADNLSNLGSGIRSTSGNNGNGGSKTTSNSTDETPVVKIETPADTRFPETVAPVDIRSRLTNEILGESPEINIYQSGTIIGSDDEFERAVAKAFEKAVIKGAVFR